MYFKYSNKYWAQVFDYNPETVCIILALQYERINYQKLNLYE